jgi:mitochondrial import inner membrane translocase subunit TIM21
MLRCQTTKRVGYGVLMMSKTPKYNGINYCINLSQRRFLCKSSWNVRDQRANQLLTLATSKSLSRSMATHSQTGAKPGDGHTKSDSPKISIAQRLSLAASFSFYSVLVLGGIGLSGLVVYYFVSDILLPTSDVQVFNRAFSIIQKDPQAQKLLGSSKLSAYGESSDNKWARSRPIASRRGVDQTGREHLIMQFHVKGEIEGLVRLEMIKSDEKNHAGIGKFDFRYLLLEVPGSKRYYLIDNTSKPKPKDEHTGFLGVKWGKS